MLRLEAEVVTVEPDGRGAPEVSLDGQMRWYRTGTSGNRGRLRQRTGLLVLFGVGCQGYSTYEARRAGLPIWGMSARMRGSVLRSALVFAGLLWIGALAETHAQAPSLALDAQANSRMQVAAAALSRSLVSRPVFVATGERVGRISNVVVGPDGNSTVAIVTVRPRLGWGQITISVRRLQQVQGRLLIPDTLDAIRAMPRVRRGTEPKH